jgi:c-di-GMP-related signal transduction protein
VESYEQARWEDLSKTVHKLHLDEDKLPGIYLEACKWSNTFARM